MKPKLIFAANDWKQRHTHTPKVSRPRIIITPWLIDYEYDFRPCSTKHYGDGIIWNCGAGAFNIWFARFVEYFECRATMKYRARVIWESIYNGWEEVICMQNRFWGYLTNWADVFQMHKVLDIAREIDHNQPPLLPPPPSTTHHNYLSLSSHLLNFTDSLFRGYEGFALLDHQGYPNHEHALTHKHSHTHPTYSLSPAHANQYHHKRWWVIIVGLVLFDNSSTEILPQIHQPLKFYVLILYVKPSPRLASPHLTHPPHPTQPFTDKTTHFSFDGCLSGNL